MSQPATIRHSTLNYRPAIDGLRGLAILSVFIFHLNHKWLPGGFVGVDVFFVISGYLITSIIFKDCENGSFSLGRFYQRRIARIFPAFLTVAAATLAGAYFIYAPHDLSAAGGHFAAVVASVANVAFMVEGNYFEMSPDAQPFLHYWSLSVEEQFYIFFPLLFLLVFKYGRKRLVLTLGALWAGSFLWSLVMLQSKPGWAFYLLPTRAWELFAGCLLAVITAQAKPAPEARWARPLSAFSLGLIALSFLLVREGNHFPGYWALLPVAGAVGVLMPATGNAGISEKWLGAAPLVAAGRISYSLYLWHWPIFSLVDYKLFFAPEPDRLALKVCLSFLAAILSFWLIENPARLFLNQRKSMPLAYASLGCAVALCVPLGIAVGSANFVNAKARDVTRGGLVFHARGETRSVVLMGDSIGSMYGKVMKEICADLGYKLTVISVSARDPLPSSNVASGQLWLDSLAVVRREKPDCLVLACSWENKLKDDKQRLALAVEALRPYVGNLVLLNQVPSLPANANRESIRQGARPPFYEDAETRRLRLQSNEYVNSFNAGNCSVLDVAAHFQTTNGAILFLDGQGRQIYHDRWHLSDYGADLVRSDLSQAVSPNARASKQVTSINVTPTLPKTRAR